MRENASRLSGAPGGRFSLSFHTQLSRSGCGSLPVRWEPRHLVYRRTLCDVWALRSCRDAVSLWHISCLIAAARREYVRRGDVAVFRPQETHDSFLFRSRRWSALAPSSFVFGDVLHILLGEVPLRRANGEFAQRLGTLMPFSCVTGKAGLWCVIV